MSDAIAAVRAFNRFYTGRLGVLGPRYLRTPHTLAEARVLYELMAGELEVAELRRRMAIDAGHLSRLLGRLERRGLVARERSAADRRRQRAWLTDAGADGGRHARPARDRGDRRAARRARRGGAAAAGRRARRGAPAARSPRPRAGGRAPRPAPRRSRLDRAAKRRGLRRGARLERRVRGARRADRRRLRGDVGPGARGALDRRGGRRAGRVRVLRAQVRHGRAAPRAAGGAAGARARPRRAARRRVRPLRPPRRLSRARPVDQRPARACAQDLRAGGVHARRPRSPITRSATTSSASTGR